MEFQHRQLQQHHFAEMFMQYNPTCVQIDGDIYREGKIEAERGGISAQLYSRRRLYLENQYLAVNVEFVADHHKEITEWETREYCTVISIMFVFFRL